MRTKRCHIQKHTCVHSCVLSGNARYRYRMQEKPHSTLGTCMCTVMRTKRCHMQKHPCAYSCVLSDIARYRYHMRGKVAFHALNMQCVQSCVPSGAAYKVGTQLLQHVTELHAVMINRTARCHGDNWKTIGMGMQNAIL